MRKGWRSFRTLMGFSFGAAPGEATLFLLLGALMSMLGPVTAFGAKLLVDSAVAHDSGRGLTASLLLAGSGALGLLIVLYYVDFLFSVAEKTGAAVDRRLIEVVGRLPGMAHHEQPQYLDRMDLLREDRPLLAWMTNATAGVIRVVVQLVATAVLLFHLSPFLLLLPLVGFLSFWTGRREQELQRQTTEAHAEDERLRRHLFETATSASASKEIRIFGLSDELARRHEQVASRTMQARDAAEWKGAWLSTLGGLASGLAYAAAIGLVLVRAVNGQATPGDVVLAIGLAAGMNALVFTAVFYGTNFLRLLQTANRYLWLEKYGREAESVAGPHADPPAHLRHGIEMRAVGFTYSGTDRAILDDLTLMLPAGSVVALVGENGAGKSTLVKLLCEFYQPTSGEIRIDGIDLHTFSAESWRSRIAAGFQDFVRFELLTRETVGIGDEPRMQDLTMVTAAVARAGAESVVTDVGGLDTQLGRAWKDGVDLSGGQWQKLALARAMMREQPLLLVLDEPTASLDAEAEHRLFERYAEAARYAGESVGTVTLLVTHRFSTVRMADLIVVLDGGRIVEQGDHEALMHRRGLYAELYDLQARPYR